MPGSSCGTGTTYSVATVRAVLSTDGDARRNLRAAPRLSEADVDDGGVDGNGSRGRVAGAETPGALGSNEASHGRSRDEDGGVEHIVRREICTAKHVSGSS